MDCFTSSLNEVRRKISEAYENYERAIEKAVERNYGEQCSPLSLSDELWLRYSKGYYHYTLYYYDRAGNLVRTVPPAGVSAKGYEHSRVGGSVFYGYVTDYRYNALGEVTQTQTPDGGVTDVVYNRAGLVRFSRNARQALLNKYTYTKYDVLGRTVESGEATGVLPTELNANDPLYPSSGVREYVVRTKYTEPISGYGSQRHLRSRVSWVEIDKDGNAATTGDIARSVYSYDPHGNVEWVVHDLPAGYVSGSARVSAKVEYEYDLVSGKVLKLKYQSGKTDNFYTRYTYDSDNRIRSVETSRDGVVWERDAEYGYYAHGPLKRVQIGEDGVQGIDYTYTLQGWLKAINHPHASDRSKDPGGDGHGGSRTPGDAFSMALHYFDGDFRRAGSAFNTSGTAEASVRPGVANNLYNGNISGWVQRTVQPSGEASVFAGIYTYDRLNRLRREQRALWGGSAFGAATDAYGSEYVYDPNGNILNLVRKDSSGVQMFDRFRYDYVAGKNRLASVYDSASARFRPGVSGAHTDIAPGLRQYSYDATGNVVADGGKAITWTPYGKVESVEKETGAGVVRFLYDAQGNRVLKEETGAGGVVSKRTWYMRDAAGQHLATYEHTDTTVAPRAKEYLLYGSGRLGTAYADNAHGGAPVSGALYRRVVGKKQYEVSDHLGNVRATVGDVKVRSGSTFAARVESFTEYFAFGMEAKSGGSGGRFGFNGYEKADEVAEGKYSADYREYDSRVARWTALDPRLAKYPDHSPYSAYGGNPILFADIKGDSLTPALYAALMAARARGEERLQDRYLSQETKDQITKQIAQFDEEVKELIKSEIIYDLIYESDLFNNKMPRYTRKVEGLSRLEEGTGGLVFAEDFNRITMIVRVDGGFDSDLTLARVLHEFKHLHQYERRQIAFHAKAGESFPIKRPNASVYDAFDELYAFQRMIITTNMYDYIRTARDVVKINQYKNLEVEVKNLVREEWDDGSMDINLYDAKTKKFTHDQSIERKEK